jgi:carbon monoxide dehydrogenase subunit G
MALYRHTVQIERAPPEVFAFVTDPANYPRWQPSLVEVRPHSRGPLRVGSEATELRRFLGREVETTWTCVEHEPVSRSAIETDDGPVPFRGTFKLEPFGGGTRLTWSVETWGAASRLGGPLVGRATRRELEANARRLKQLLEGELASLASEARMERA